jgi:class 3 adenylate cyclase
MWQLVINGPGYFDTAYELPEGVISLGRGDDNDIVLSGDLVSRKHARIIRDNEAVFVEDLGSRNGSRLNDVEFRGRVSLRVGDIVTVGENALALRQPHQAERAATEMVQWAEEGKAGLRVDRDSAIVVARNVRESVLLRALDNVGPVSFLPGPYVPGPAGRPTVDYDTLLLLYRVTERLGGAKSLHDFFEESLDRLLSHSQALEAVLLFRNSQGELSPCTVRQKAEDSAEVPLSPALIQQALSRGEGLFVTDSEEDSDRRVHPLVCVPLLAARPAEGVLYLRLSEPPLDPEAMLDGVSAVAQLLCAGLSRFGPQCLFPGEAPPALTVRDVTVLALHVEGTHEWLLTASAAEAGEWLQGFQRRQTEVIQSFHGEVHAVLGDSLLAVFGLSGTEKDSAVRAVRAALSLQQEWQKHTAKARLGLKVAVHHGQVWAGWGGAPRGLVGPALGLTQELLKQAQPGQILMTGPLFVEVGTRFEVAPMGEHSFEGGRSRLPVLEVTAEDLAHRTEPGKEP